MKGAVNSNTWQELHFQIEKLSNDYKIFEN